MVGHWALWSTGGAQPTSLETWVRDRPLASPPQLDTGSAPSCWEMVLLAAVRSRALTTGQVQSLYPSDQLWTAADLQNWLQAMSPHGRCAFTPGTRLVPRRGDLVFWNDFAHVALALGTLDRAERHEVISFWAPPNLMWSGIPAEVRRTTIEELTAILADPTLNPGATIAVTFGPGPWAADLRPAPPVPRPVHSAP